MKLLFLFLPIFLFATPGYFEPWGKDSDLCKKKEEKQTHQLSVLTKIADKIICFHQTFLSPIDGPRSSFRPSSSHYMQEAMYHYGFFRGFIMGCDRLLRENKEKWIYQTTLYNGYEYKYDPPDIDKHFR